MGRSTARPTIDQTAKFEQQTTSQESGSTTAAHVQSTPGRYTIGETPEQSTIDIRSTLLRDRLQPGNQIKELRLSANQPQEIHRLVKQMQEQQSTLKPLWDEAQLDRQLIRLPD